MHDFNGLSCRVVFCLVLKKYVHLEVDGIVLHSIISVDGVDGCSADSESLSFTVSFVRPNGHVACSLALLQRGRRCPTTLLNDVVP